MSVSAMDNMFTANLPPDFAANPLKDWSPELSKCIRPREFTTSIEFTTYSSDLNTGNDLALWIHTKEMINIK